MKTKINRCIAVFLPFIALKICAKRSTAPRPPAWSRAYRTLLLCSGAAALWAMPATANAQFGTPTPTPTPTLGNYPNTTLLLSGNTTITPSAIPSNTTRINVSTSTNFKGVLEGTPATGVIRVTDAHPAGVHTVTVTAFSSSGSITTKTFTLTVTTPLRCDPIGYTRTNIPTGANPRFVAIGDFNSDGIQDLALACSFNIVRILLGKVTGGFVDPNPSGFFVGNVPQAIAVGDFDGDGRHDLATANSGSTNDVSVMLNRTSQGAQTLTFQITSYPTGDIRPRSVAIGDFNNDRKQDLAVVNADGLGTVSILLGTGAGTFTVLTPFPVGSAPFAVAVGNFNSDLFQDLAVTRQPGTNDNVSIFLGSGTGSFTAAPPVNVVGNRPISVAVGNFNSDLFQDLATANEGDDASVLRGSGGGNFAPALPVPGFSPALPQSVATGDFDNSSGLDDLVVASSRGPSGPAGIVSVVLNTGNPNFGAPKNFSVGIYPSAVAVGDFNGDGRQDLAVSNYGSNNVSVLLRQPCPCAPTFSENFDGVVRPNLPTGWTATNGVGSLPPFWVTSNQFPDTAAGLNNAFVDDPAGPSDKYLETPPIPIPFVFLSAQVSFRQLYNLESTYDGGVLEISSPNINGGAFTDIITAGGSFVTGDYNATINNGYGSAIAGRRAWSGNSCCYICTVVNLPGGVIGQTIKLRWRMASDNSIAGTGWRIDKVQVSNGTGSTCCATGPVPTILASVSTRALVGTGDNAGIGGFIIMGSAPKPVLLRAIGPSLTQFGVPNALGDPVLELNGPAGFATITNNNWRDTQEAEIQATGIPPTNDLESAIAATLDPGAYTAVLTGNGNTSGVALVEVYDVDQEAPSTLANISTRAFVGTADNILIAGVVVARGDLGRLVFRGIGPSLTAVGVPNALENPTLELRDSNGALLVANNDWQDDPAQAAELTAAGLAPNNNLESGIFATLPPGAYTALLAGVNNTTGIGLVEAYELDAIDSTTASAAACLSQ